MDSNRFDNLAKLVGKGASRRSILKGLLGLGGAAVAGTVRSDDTAARTIGSRPTIPPPPPPTTTTTTTTAAPCPAGQQQCPNSTLCCPTGTCARSGAAAICCDGTLGNGTVVCGLDCCADALQCCDGECCPDGTICLTRVFAEGPYVEEETCCPTELACRTASGDGICCDGACFDPALSVNGGNVITAQVEPFEQTCCPAQGTVCEGIKGTLCCQGETPDCCVREGVAACINAAAGQCCRDDDCTALDDAATCTRGVCNDTFACEPASTCGGTTPYCCGEDNLCCANAAACCQRTIPATGEPVAVCIDPAVQCCTTQDCLQDFGFDQGCVVCPLPGRPGANTCVPRNEGETCGTGECDTCYQGQCLGCEAPETCCVNAPFPVCIDVSQEGVCCTNDQCPDDPETCEEGVCTATVCSLQSICQAGEVCCADAAGGFACIPGTSCPTTTTTAPTTTTTVAPTTTTTTAVPTTTTTTPACQAAFTTVTCPSSGNTIACCSGCCDANAQVCKQGLGGVCTDDIQCCSGFCDGIVCGNPPVTTTAAPTTTLPPCQDAFMAVTCPPSGATTACCSGCCNVDAQVCLQGIGGACTDHVQCCSGFCNGLTCAVPPVTTTTTQPQCQPNDTPCGEFCCSSPTPFCLDPDLETCVECIEDLTCGSDVCCLNICCDTGQVCFDETFSQVSIAAVVGCCTPGGCPTLFLGEQCGAGLTETDCGTILTEECPCDGELNLECVADVCCRSLDGACDKDSDCCGNEPCSNGLCGCRGESEACGTTDDCCSGFCADSTCVPCFEEFQGPCITSGDCCGSLFCDTFSQECRRQ
jgi:hypothetical protein